MRSLGWHFVHNLIAHPLLCLPTWFDFPDKFHDWTANKAYWQMPTGFLAGPLPKEIDLWEIPDDN